MIFRIIQNSEIMKKYGLCFSLLIWNLLAFSQNLEDSQSLVSWYITEQGSEQCFQWIEQNTGNIISFPNQMLSDETYLNFNPSLVFEGKNSSVLLEEYDLTECTIFIVYQESNNDKEQIIYHLNNDSTTNLVLTNKRLANLKDITYVNYVEENPKSSINTFVQNLQGKSTNSNPFSLSISNSEVIDDLPVEPFIGKIPEVLIFDRVLSPKERQKIESYLALKYGITLQSIEPIYLNSNGETIWNGKDFKTFSNNIAGIGRDDEFSLYQKQASGSYNPSLLQLGINEIAINNKDNKGQIEAGSFLIWGDNNEDMELVKDNLGQSKQLKRKWLMQSIGSISSLETVLKFDVLQIETPLEPEETYWLCIDRSGTGLFPMNEVEYIKMDHLLNNHFAVFKNINWDTDDSKTDLFTIAVGSEMMAQFWVDLPTCQPEIEGKLNVQIIGGKAPFNCRLQNEHGLMVKEWQPLENTIESIEILDNGTYTLFVEDENRETYYESFFIHSKDAPLVNLSDGYVLPDKESLTLNAEIEAANIDYHWQGPEGFESFEPQITINQVGIYEIELNQEGCRSKKQIQVEGMSQNLFDWVRVYPNPIAVNEFFNIAVKLTESVPIEVTIYDLTGKLVLQRTRTAAKYHPFSEKINASGLYIVHCISNGQKYTFKIQIE